MRPGALKRGLAVLGCGVLTVTVSGCESTEHESAKIGREAQKLGAGPAALELGAANHDVRVSDATLVNSGGRMAVAVKLTATSPRAQLDVPLLVSVTGAAGKVVYTNEAGGVEASLQRMGLLRPHQSAWWVDDQVLTSQSTSGVKVRAGTGRTPDASAKLPRLSASAAQVSQQAGISVLNGTLVNHSSTAESKVPVFAAAVRNGKVVAAGRAVVNELAGHSGASAPFQIFFVGNPTGAKIELTAVPAAA